MALFILIVMPIAWGFTGRLAGFALASTIPVPRLQYVARRGGIIAMWSLPAIYSVMALSGISGDAGHGFLLFGSAGGFEVICAPIYLVPVITMYIGGVFVVRDILRGLATYRAQ